MKRPNRKVRNGISRRHGVALVLAESLVTPFAASRGGVDETVVRVGYIRSMARHTTISQLDQPAPDAGLDGATLAMDDNNATGRLEGQNVELVDVPVCEGADLAAALGGLAATGVKLVLTGLPAGGVQTLADTGRASGMTIFNLAAPDDALRQQDCRANLIHVAPSGVAAYKGQRLTLRSRDLRPRQPILLADGRTIVSISPQPAFPRQVTELNTLGIDRPETKCTLR